MSWKKFFLVISVILFGGIFLPGIVHSAAENNTTPPSEPTIVHPTSSDTAALNATPVVVPATSNLEKPAVKPADAVPAALIKADADRKSTNAGEKNVAAPSAPSSKDIAPKGVSAQSPDVILDAQNAKNAHTSILNKFPPLVQFMLGLTVLLMAPLLARRFDFPDVVVLIALGVILGPFGFGVFFKEGPIISIFSEMGKLLLLFFAGMEIDLVLFQKARWQTSFFGFATLLIPLAAGIGLGYFFGYGIVAAVLIGSLLASHTLLGYPIVQKYNLLQHRPVIVTVGATIFTDTISLIILALCVSIHTMGFQPVDTAIMIGQIIVYILVVIFGLGKIVRWYYRTHKPTPETQMLTLLVVVMAAAVLAEMIHLESIVGAFMAGLAVNRALRGTPTQEHIEVLGKTLFVPTFFLAIGLSLDLPQIWFSMTNHFVFVASMSAGLIAAKFLAAALTGMVFRYKLNEWLNMWSLSIPQVAATLAAALVAFHSINSAGVRLIDQNVLSSVLVMVVVTAIGGPMLTEIFARKIKEQTDEGETPQSDTSSGPPSV